MKVIQTNLYCVEDLKTLTEAHMLLQKTEDLLDISVPKSGNNPQRINLKEKDNC